MNAVTVTNGYDPRLDAAAEQATLPSLPPDRRLIVHTGALSGPRGRDAGPLLEAMQRLLDEPEVDLRIVLVQAGPTLPADEPSLPSCANAGSRSPSESSPARSRSRFNVAPRCWSCSPRKRSASPPESCTSTWHAGRPILALATGNEAARIVGETGTGIAVPPNDVDAIAAELRRGRWGSSSTPMLPRGVGRYTYPAPADAMARLVESAIMHRTGAVR